MKTVMLIVGSSAPGHPTDGGYSRTKTVEFRGEKLAGYRDGDTRGIKKKLYRTEDGRLILWKHDFSRWQGEHNRRTIEEVTEEEVIENHEQLAQIADIKKTWSLDEVLD